MHWARFAFCVLAGFLTLLGFAIVAELWQLVSGEPQYRMRLTRDFNLGMALFGWLYYLLRAAFEALVYDRLLVELPNAGAGPHPRGGA